MNEMLVPFMRLDSQFEYGHHATRHDITPRSCYLPCLLYLPLSVILFLHLIFMEMDYFCHRLIPPLWSPVSCSFPVLLPG
jgi:hypothetical protein